MHYDKLGIGLLYLVSSLSKMRRLIFCWYAKLSCIESKDLRGLSATSSSPAFLNSIIGNSATHWIH